MYIKTGNIREVLIEQKLIVIIIIINNENPLMVEPGFES